MKVYSRSRRRIMISIAILVLIVRLTLVFTNPPPNSETYYWLPLDVVLLFLSVFPTFLPEPCSIFWHSKDFSSERKNQIDFVLGCKLGTLIVFAFFAFCVCVGYWDFSIYSSYFLVIGILIDRWLQTYDLHPFWRLSQIGDRIKDRIAKKEEYRAKDPTKALIGYHKKRMRRLTISLGNSKGVLVSIFVLTILLVVSYLYEGAWISNVLISIGAGIVTGLVFYFLSNYRNNKMAQLQLDISALAPFMSVLSDISHYQMLAKWHKSLGGDQMSQEDIAYKIMECIDELAESVGQIGYELYQELELDIDDPVDRDKCKALRDSLEKIEISKDYKAWSISTYKTLIGLHDKVDGLLKDKKDTLEILQKHIF